jgi:hypothetical protein
MAPKILLKDLKGGTKSQWNHRNEEYYKMVIKGLDRMTFEKVNDYIQKSWNFRGCTQASPLGRGRGSRETRKGRG